MAAKRPHVLIVEEGHLMRVRLRTVLEAAGCEISTATDGAMALDLLQDLDGEVRLIIANLSSRLRGTGAFLEQLIEHPRWSAIPVVALSATGGEGLNRLTRLNENPTDTEIVSTVLRLAR